MTEPEALKAYTPDGIEWTEYPADSDEDAIPFYLYDGSKYHDIVIAASYDVEQNYGGPEEGGWWYDSGTLVEMVACRPEDRDSVVAALEEKYPRTNRRYSVHGGTDHDVHVYTDKFPQAFFPAETPHYE